MILADAETERMLFGAAASIVSALAVAVTVLWRASVARNAAEIEDLKKQRAELLRIILANGLRSSIPESVPRSALPGAAHDMW